MRILCTLPNASNCISGVAFEQIDGGVLSEEIDEQAAELFLSVPGFAAYQEGGEDAGEFARLQTEAEALGIKVKGNWKIARLSAEIENAKAAAASAAAAL